MWHNRLFDETLVWCWQRIGRSVASLPGARLGILNRGYS
jgi:hypothetical protein